jgi:hypothetical protein
MDTNFFQIELREILSILVYKNVICLLNIRETHSSLKNSSNLIWKKFQFLFINNPNFKMSYRQVRKSQQKIELNSKMLFLQEFFSLEAVECHSMEKESLGIDLSVSRLPFIVSHFQGSEQSWLILNSTNFWGFNRLPKWYSGERVMPTLLIILPYYYSIIWLKPSLSLLTGGGVMPTLCIILSNYYYYLAQTLSLSLSLS